MAGITMEQAQLMYKIPTEGAEKLTKLIINFLLGVPIGIIGTVYLIIWVISPLDFTSQTKLWMIIFSTVVSVVFDYWDIKIARRFLNTITQIEKRGNTIRLTKHISGVRIVDRYFAFEEIDLLGEDFVQLKFLRLRIASAMGLGKDATFYRIEQRGKKLGYMFLRPADLEALEKFKIELGSEGTHIGVMN